MSDNATFLTREPAVNRKQAITANRLFLHASSTQVALEELARLRPCWPSAHTVFLSFGRLVPGPELLDWSWPEGTFLEIPAPALTHPKVQALLPLVHAQGIPLCLGWYDGVSPVPPIGDWRFTLVDLRRSSVPGQAPGIALAWGLTDSSAFADTIARGFSGACGWFFLRGTPEVVQKRATPSFGIVLQLIQKLQRDADIAEIEELLKRDVALSYRLLRYINSAGMGLMCEVTSFRHAVQILGYRNLLKWLSLLLLNASQHPSQQALAQTSIVRGRFMEEIGKGFFSAEITEQLFLCGVFSILDVLLGVPMVEVLQNIAVSEAIREALTRGQGEFAPFLELARACESPDAALLRHHAEKLGLASLTLNRAHLTALEYADRLNA